MSNLFCPAQRGNFQVGRLPVMSNSPSLEDFKALSTFLKRCFFFLKYMYVFGIMVLWIKKIKFGDSSKMDDHRTRLDSSS